jgi:hypothetical protein
MSSEMVRWGGLAGLAAGLMYLLSGILTLIAAPQIILGSLSYYLIEIVLVAAFALTLVTIVGLHALQRGRYGRLGTAGSLLTFVGYALVLVSAHLITVVGGRTRLLRSPHGRVGNGRRFDTPGSHDALRAGAAVVGRGAAHSLIPPRRYPGLGRSKREHRVRGGMGVARLRALLAGGTVAEQPSRVS